MTTGQRIALIAAIATIVGTVVTIAAFGYQILRDQASSSGPDPRPTDVFSSSRDSVPSRSATPQSAATNVAPPPPRLTTFDLGTAKLETGTSGKSVGPNQYQFVAGDDAPFYVGYTWSGRFDDGTEDVGTECSLLFTFSGPRDPPSERFSDCSVSDVPFLGGNGGNDIKVSSPGSYHIHVVDGQSGATGDVDFTVYG